MRIIALLFFALLISLNAHSQCDNPESKEFKYTDGSIALYYGCLDDQETPNGNGKMIYPSGDVYDGNWLDFRFSGYGEFIYKNGSYYKGQWLNHKKNGEGYSFKISENGTNEKEGFFEDDDLYNGISKTSFVEGDKIYEEYKEGELIVWEYIFKSGDKITREGSFKSNNKLREGVEKTFQADGLEIILTYENGRVTETIRNDVNYYKYEDIIGDKDYTTINLKQEGDINYGISYIIEMYIDGVKGEWVFDSGAQNFSIGKRMFERLVREGNIKYRDLNRTIQTFGIGGMSSGKLILIDKISIGDYTIKNIIAEVSLDNNMSLLGVEFLNKFSNVEWNMKNKTLILYK